MNNWYVAMSRGEDAPVLDVTKPAVPKCYIEIDERIAQDRLIPERNAALDCAVAYLASLAKPAAPPEFKRGDRVMFEGCGGVSHPAEFISDEGAAYILESLATHWWKRYEKANTTELRHATPDEIARYWPESAAQASNLEDSQIRKTPLQKGPAIEQEAPVAADQWIEWRQGFAQPTGNVDVLLRDGSEYMDLPAASIVWCECGIGTITHYRVAQ